MAIIGNSGQNISYDSENLIAELREDIAEFGPNEVVYAFFKWYDGVKIYTNYDFKIPEMPIHQYEIEENEKVDLLKAGRLLELLIEQDSIL